MPNPPDIKTFPRRVDPNMPKRGFYAVLTRGDQVRDILQTGEEIVSFTVTPNSEATAAGLKVLSDADFLPRYSDLVFGFWIDVDPSLRGSTVFNGTGIVLGVEISFVTNLQQSDQITVGIRVVTQGTVLGGTVNNGSRVSATFSFYQGEVGVRDRGGIFDVSFFATSTPVIPRKMEGILDGKLVKILSVDDRHLAANGQPPRDGEVRIVTLCVAPATPA